MGKKVLMQGNEACVEGAIAAGMRFYAGYPITPSTEIAEVSALRLPQVGGKFIQMEDEIASIACAIGASTTGTKAMTATSGPGFSLKQENLGYACLAEIPLVVVDVQRSGPSTGLPTSPSQGDVMMARWGTHGDHPVIALSPSSVKETYELAIRCFNLAEKYRTPVLFMMDEIIGHLREGVELPEPGSFEIISRKEPETYGPKTPAYHLEEGELVPTMTNFGHGERYNITGLLHDETGFPTNNNQIAGELVTRLMRKIDENYEDIVRVEEIDTSIEDAPVIQDGDYVLGVRPEFIRLAEDGIEGEIYGAMPTGMESTLKIRTGDFLLTSVVFGDTLYTIGSTTHIHFTGDSIMLFDRKSGRYITSGTVEV